MKIKANQRSSSEKKEVQKLRVAAQRAAKTPQEKMKDLDHRREQELLR